MSELATDRDSVLITGSRGRVGRAITPGLSRLFRVAEFDASFPQSDTDAAHLHGDITEFAIILAAVEKTKPDCIVHLAANADQDASAEEIYAPNYIGVRNIYEAAAQLKVPKVVFASSLHTLSGHPGFPYQSPFEDGRKFTPDDAYNPGNPYGESKVWAEQLAQEYYDAYAIRTVSLRLGDLSHANRPSEDPQFTAIWLSHSDATQAFARAILVNPPKPVSVYFVTSDNDGPYDIQPTITDLGYAPVDGLAQK